MAKGKVDPVAGVLFGVRYFPHQLSFLLFNPLRRLVIPPQTVVEPTHMRRLAEAEGFLHQRFYGRWYNYTAIFTKPG